MTVIINPTTGIPYVDADDGAPSFSDDLTAAFAFAALLGFQIIPTKTARDALAPDPGKAIFRQDGAIFELWNGQGWQCIGNHPKRNFSKITNTSPGTGGGISCGTYVVDPQPYPQRVELDISGEVRPDSDGDIGVGVTSSAGTLVVTQWTRITPGAGKWGTVSKSGWVTLLANQGTTIQFTSEQSVPGALSVFTKAKVLAAGEY